MLIENVGGISDTGNETDDATCDIVRDIFRYYDETDDLTILIRQKMDRIKNGNKKNNL